MSNHADKYHDSSFATLFDAFYEVQTPRAQERLNAWMLVAAAGIRKDMGGSTLAETALEMAQALLWSLYIINAKQFIERITR